MINLIQPLAVYDRLNEQERFKENIDGLYKLLSPSTALIPFQIKIPFEFNTIDHIFIRGYKCAYEVVVLNNALHVGLKSTIDKKWFVYDGSPLKFVRENGNEEPLILSPDYYYFEVSINGRKYYTEVFCVPGEGICDVPINMTIEAFNEATGGNYYFDEGFKFRAYFNSIITNVTPDITDEFTKDGYERQILQRRVIVYNRQIELDPMVNSASIGLSMMTGLNHIVIYNNGNEYNVRDISYKQNIIDGGGLDTVGLTFSIFDEDMIKTNC